MSILLSKATLDEYAGRKAPHGVLGEFTSYRSYHRWLEEKGRRETWLEVAKRAVEYNVGLYEGPASPDDLRLEAEYMFQSLFNLEVFPSGRTLWIGGTPVSYSNPEANFNCAFVVIDSIESLCDMFYLLMMGSGVGFRMLPKDVQQLPRFRPNVSVKHHDYDPVEKSQRRDDTEMYILATRTAVIVVGDSKEGWKDALQHYIELHTIKYPDVKTIEVVYNHVRPRGERLKKFGGWASGHETFRYMFERMHEIFNARGAADGLLRGVDVLDTGNLIGENVVAGGVRRTSEIGIGSPDDEEFTTAKVNLDYTGPYKHRRCSNNTQFYEERPTLAKLSSMMDVIRELGEPGFLNASAARARRPWFEGLNPCAEILLDNRGVCNLSTVVISRFVTGGVLNWHALVNAFKLAVRIGVRMTNVNLSMPKWNKVQRRDRLTGVSVTGWRDFCYKLGMSTLSEQASEIRMSLKKICRNEAIRYASEMRIPVPLLVTTVKPEGTLSCLPTVSSGIHHPFAPYYIRRIRVSYADPLVEVMSKLGHNIVHEPSDKSTAVIDFPVKSAATKSAAEETALEQLKNYVAFQKEYTDHNTSCTVYVGENEWDGVAKFVHENWDDVVALSFLPKTTGSHPLMPYEQIDEDTYNSEMSKIKPFDVDLLHSIEKTDGSTELIDPSCEGGVCPIR